MVTNVDDQKCTHKIQVFTVPSTAKQQNGSNSDDAETAAERPYLSNNNATSSHTPTAAASSNANTGNKNGSGGSNTEEDIERFEIIKNNDFFGTVGHPHH